MACQVETNNQGKIIDVKNEKGQSSTLFKEIFNIPILSLDESIEIYKNTYSEKIREKRESNKNVDFIFKQNKELSSIGTKEDYKQYLETVFPDSKVSDVVYHGTKRDFDVFDERQIGTESDKNKEIGDFGEGFYFTEVLTRAQGYATDMQTGKQMGRVISALVNIQNPDSSSKKNKEQLLAEGNDGVIVSYGNRKYDEIVVPNASQIYVLGSQTDLENFKNWKQSSSEPTLLFKTPAGEKYNNYQEALQNTSEGDIELQANDVIVGKVNSDTSIDNYNGLLNHLTKQGILKSQRILDVNGDQLFIPTGETDSARQLSSNILEDILVKQLGQSSVTRMDDGSFQLEDNLNTRIINGKKIKESEISDLDYEQLKNLFGEETAIELEVEKEFEKGMLPSKLKRRIDEDTIIKTEDELTRSVKTLLNKVGVNITSIEDYEKHYSIKNGGVNPSASALMDVTNKIMAFRNGTITNEDLIEETMHLIEASLDPALTAALRANIHTTPEWKELSKQYYDIYSKEYSGKKLEEMVRREILGKVMSNGVATNFQLSQEDSPTQISIFQQIVQLLDGFFAKVNAYFTNSTQQQIDDLNKDIYVKLLSGELANELDVNQNFGTKFRLYSASTNLNNDLVQIQKQAEKALTILESQSYQIGRNDASQRQQLRSARESLAKSGERIEETGEQKDIMSKAEAEKLANAELAATFSYITNVAQKQLTYLQRAVKRNADNNYPFSAEESSVYHSMITQFDKYILPSVTATLENKRLRTKTEDRILEEVKKVSEGVEKLKQTVNVNEDTYKKLLVDILVKRLSLSVDKRAFIEDKVNSLQKESNFMFTYFGNLLHSSNIFLNSAAHVVNKTDQERRQATLEQTLPFVQKLKKLNYLDGQKLKELIKDGFIQNRFNDKIREDALQQAQYAIYKNVSGQDISFTAFSNKKNFNDLTVDQKSEMNKQLNDWKLENYTLSALSPEEMRERKTKLESYSEVTQNYERVSSSAYADLMQNAEILNNVPVFTQDMKYDFEKIKKQRAYDKSIYDLEGELKEGVEYRNAQDYENSLVNGLETDIVKIGNNLFVSLIPGTNDNASILSVELSKIDNNRITAIKANTEQKEFSPKFIETLSTLEPSEAYDFLMLNSYVGYTNDYYESLDRPSIIDRLSDELGKDNDWKIEDLIQKIATTTKKMNTILQANRVMNNPSEVSYENMEKNTEITYVKQYAQDLENYYSQASTLIAKNNEEIEEDNISETIPNESFRAYMSDKHLVSQLVYEKDSLDEDDIQNIDKIFSEIVDHSTQKNKLKVLELRSFVKDFSNGRVNKIPKSYSRIFTLTEQEYNDISAEQVFSAMTNDLLQYSYTRLLPYFRKSQPTGVDIALNELRSGTVTASDFMQNYLEGRYPYLNISPNYNFQQANEQNNKNPHFQQAKLQGTPLFRTFELSTTLEDVSTKSVDQLVKEGKLNKFVNKDFLKEYDIDLVKLFETGEEAAKKNVEKFEARQAFVDLQKKTLENYRMTNAHSVYQLPQKERGRLRKISELFTKGKGAKEIVDEATNYREDESSLGQDSAGSNLRSTSSATIPKFGLRKLTKGEVTDSLLESYIWMNNESNLFQARSRNIGDMLAIKEALIGSQFENNLNVESTNTYKMLEDQLKYSFFGVKETFSKEFQLFGKTYDLGQILKTFGRLIRLKNLAYNITIPVTSMLSGSVQLRIEKAIGERVDDSGFSRGRKRFYKESGDAMRDMFSLESTSWLNAMGSKFGFYENQERYNESEYGKAVRGLGRSAFIAHTAANFAPNSITALSVLGDHRFVNGQLIQYRDFKEDNKGKSDKEIRAVWDNYTDIMDVSLVDENGVIYYDYAKIADALNNNMTEEEAKAFMEGKDNLIAGRIKLAIQFVDQQVATVDKSILSRNAFTSFLGVHRNWLFLAVQNKLKARQISTLTGNFEEGSWATSFRVINSIVSDIKAGKTKDVLKYIKGRWETGNDTSRKNLIRGVAEMTFLNALIALTVMGIKELGDDDEDTYAFKVANLFLMRTTSEIASSTVALPKNTFDILSNATVGTNLVDMAFDAPDLFTSEEVSRGRFQGYSKRARYLLRNLPAVKDLYNLYDIENTISSYRHFNLSDKEGGDNNLKYWTVYPLLVEEQ